MSNRLSLKEIKELVKKANWDNYWNSLHGKTYRGILKECDLSIEVKNNYDYGWDKAVFSIIMPTVPSLSVCEQYEHEYVGKSQEFKEIYELVIQKVEEANERRSQKTNELSDKVLSKARKLIFQSPNGGRQLL